MSQQLKYSNSHDIKNYIGDVRHSFESGTTLSFKWRIQQLKSMRAMVKENEEEICRALREDLGRCTAEAIMGAIVSVLNEVQELSYNLAQLMRPRPVANPVGYQPGKAYIKPEPLGVILIITPWNFPCSLPLAILAGAIAAGNTIILKLSERSPATSSLLGNLITKYLDTTCIKVVQGGKTETTQLLEAKFDHICYTGGEAVGKIVMQHAAKTLTPVTLELGGKCPVYVHSDATLSSSARKILQGRLFNAGQMCISPDYVIVHESKLESFIEAIKTAARQFYGPDLKKSPDYGRIIDERHFDQLNSYLKDDHGGEVITIGGPADEADLFLPFSIVKNPSDESAVMNEVTFGPILVVKSVPSLESAIQLIRSKPKPLAAYLCSNNKHIQQIFEDRVSSGSLGINEILFQATHPNLPFGGVGSSGMGAYRIAKSFETFSHMKSVLSKPAWFDPPQRYPPYTSLNVKMIRPLYDGTVNSILRLARKISTVVLITCSAVFVAWYWASNQKVQAIVN